MFTTAGRDLLLDQMDGRYCGLITTITAWRTPTVVEASYAGYSATRPAITFGAQGATTPAGGRVVENSGTVTFGEKTDAGSVDIIAWGLYTAASAGTLLAIVPLSDRAPLFAVAETVSEDIYCPAHNLAVGARVYVQAQAGAVLPVGLAEDVRYFVITAGHTADKFRLSTTSEGAAENISAGGQVLIIKSVPVAVAQNATPSFAAGALSIAI